MKKFLLIILVLWGSSSTVNGRFLPSNHPRYIQVKKTLDELIAVSGENKADPGLIIYEAPKRGVLAAYILQQQSIVMDEILLDMLDSIPGGITDGLALILGHELAHYYLNHGWLHSFSADEQLFLDLKEVDAQARIEHESEADDYGSFYAYMAGYDPSGISESLFEMLYDEYGIDTVRSINYPSLSERISIYQASLQKLQRLIPIFEAGNHLMLMGHHSEAATCFAEVSRTYAASEVFNNIGVAYAQAALKMIEQPGNKTFFYPVLFYEESQLKSLANRWGGDPSQAEVMKRLRREYLEKALKNLKKCLLKDETNAAAWINLACVRDAIALSDPKKSKLAWIMGLQEIERALAFATNARERSLALTARGILFWHQDSLANRNLAERAFIQAAKKGGLFAKTNAQIFKGVWKDKTLAPKVKTCPEGESIANITLVSRKGEEEFIDIMEKGPYREIIIPPLRMRIYHQEVTPLVDGWLIYSYQSDLRERNQTRILSTQPGYEGTTCLGIGLGDKQKAILSNYGKHPSDLKTGVKYTYMHYLNQGIYFAVDESKQVAQWMTCFRRGR